MTRKAAPAGRRFRLAFKSVPATEVLRPLLAKDGNGRWATLLANVWLMQHDQLATLWPATELRYTESPIRDEYIAAIKRGDMRNYGPLIDLHKRFSE